MKRLSRKKFEEVGFKIGSGTKVKGSDKNAESTQSCVNTLRLVDVCLKETGQEVYYAYTKTDFSFFIKKRGLYRS